MNTMSTTDVKNRIDELWDLANNEPVIVERNGTPRYLVTAFDKYVAVPCAEYDRMTGTPPIPRLGFAKQLFAGADTDALLNVDLSDVMREYTG